MRLVAVRVLDCAGIGLNSSVIAGVDWVTGNHQPGQPAVANMSLGGGKSTALEQAVANSITDGVTYAVAAGNETEDACTGSPSGLPAAITVGATTNTDAKASYSDFGPCVDFFAPGSNITSASWLTDTGTATMSGTSMASPHVAGAAALYLQGTPAATPAAGARRALHPDDEEHRHGRAERQQPPPLLEPLEEAAWRRAGSPASTLRLCQGENPTPPNEFGPVATDDGGMRAVVGEARSAISASRLPERLFEPSERRLSFWLFVPSSSGYAVREEEGDPPSRGEYVALDDVGYRVTTVGPSPFRDGRQCAYLERAAAAHFRRE